MSESYGEEDRGGSKAVMASCSAGMLDAGVLEKPSTSGPVERKCIC